MCVCVPGGVREKKTPVTRANLDDDLDKYMMRDKKKGASKLNDDLDDYFKQKKEAATAAAEEPAEKGTDGEKEKAKA